MTDSTPMRIGELASRTGVSVRSLRYYETQYLLASRRSPSGQRLYSEDDVARVAFIQRMYAAGLSSRTVSDLLPCVESPSTSNDQAAFERLSEERDKLSAHIEELIATRSSLDELIEANRRHQESLEGATA